MKLFIGSLPYDLTEDELREAFAPFGEVRSVRIVVDRDTGRSKGFGFVEYTSDDAATKAVEEMNGSSLKGRSIVVDKARERQDRPQRSHQGPRY